MAAFYCTHFSPTIVWVFFFFPLFLWVICVCCALLYFYRAFWLGIVHVFLSCQESVTCTLLPQFTNIQRGRCVYSCLSAYGTRLLFALVLAHHVPVCITYHHIQIFIFQIFMITSTRCTCRTVPCML